METHELHRMLHDVVHELQQGYPSVELQAEAVNNEAFLLVTHPEGIKSKFHVIISETDEVLPQPVFQTAVDGGVKTIDESALNEKWIGLLSERIKLQGFEYFYDEIGGEGG